MLLICLLAYAGIGEAIALTALVAASEYNRRFADRKAFLYWHDLVWVAVIQFTWPLTAWAIVPYSISKWRRAVQNELCVCGHRRSIHESGKLLCHYLVRSSRWVVFGEGDEFVFCECPKFTTPKIVRNR